MKRILISNDDGFHAPGLAALHEAIADLGHIDVVAPETEQSAVSHAITIASPIRARRSTAASGFSGISVNGTPADCVKLAMTVLLKEKPSILISGINLGSNAGISVVYSGTVAAAAEAAIMGMPGMAVSLDALRPPLHWDAAAKVTRLLTEKILANGLPPETFLNVNVPNRPLEQLRGFAVTSMANSRYIEVFDRRVNPRGDEYFWLDGTLEIKGGVNNSDVQALKDGFVSLTPIGIDRTSHAAISTLNGWNLS